MSKRSYNLLTICGAVVLTAALTAPAEADYSVQHNVAFNAMKVNPYGGGPAWEWTDTVELLDESFKADIPPLNADPAGIILESLLGVELPSLVKLQVGATLAGHANVNFGYYVTAGRLDISYPASSNLNFQTLPGQLAVRSNESYGVDGGFQPGVSQRSVPSQFIQLEGGDGYFTTPLHSFTEYSSPGLDTTSPWAQAWLEAKADVRGGVHTKVSILAGLKEWRKDIQGGGQVGGRIVEIDPSGLFVAGEEVVGFDLNEPIGPIPVAGGAADLTIQIPNLAVDSDSMPQSGPVIHARKEQPFVTLTGNLERLIPFVGTILQNQIGPLGYDLLNLAGGPQIGLYQDMTFTPDPRVRLSFSEPVLVTGTPCGAAICGGAGSPHETYLAEFDLDDQIDWTPMFSNSNFISVTPTYILNNTFENETGLNLALVVDVEALSLTGEFPPFNGTLGPVYDDTVTIPLGDVELFTQTFSIPIGSVTADPIVFQKSNIDIVPGFGDLKLDLAQFVEVDPENPGYHIYNLNFSRSVDGGPPRLYQAQVSGLAGFEAWNGEDQSQFFEALADVILTDPVTSEQFNVGRNFCTGGCDLSALQPEASPGYLDANLPELGTLFLTELPDDLTFVPGVDLDPTGHPILDQYNPDDDFADDDTVAYPTEIVDRRNGPVTTILATTGDLPPEGDAQITEIQVGPPVLNDAGNAVFTAFLDVIPGTGTSAGLYLADGSGLAKVAREGDPLPSGNGTIGPLSETVVRSVNNSGQAVIGLNAQIVRSEPNGGLTEIARVTQPAPDGNGTFGALVEGRINELGQVPFVAYFYDTSGTTNQGIYVGDGNTITKIVRKGDTLPGLQGAVTFLGGSSLNDSGQLAYGVYTDQNPSKSAILLRTGSTVTTIAQSDGNAPGNGRFVTPDYPVLNEAGQVLFISQVVSLANSNDVWVGVFRSNGAEITEIVRLGQLAPNQDGTISSVFDTLLNDSGQVAFQGEVFNGVAPYSAMFLGDGTNLQQVASSGQATPDGNGNFSSFGDEGTFISMALNNAGHIAFEARLTNTAGGTMDDDGLFLYDGTNVVQVVREDQELAGSSVVSIDFDSQGFGDATGGLNDTMQVAYTAHLADGRDVVARFEPTVYWHNLGSGNWATGGNWSLGVEPTNPYDVFIVAETALTVTGPAVNRTVKSLTIGGEDTANATLDLTSGVTLTATNGTTIRPNGVVTGFGTLAGAVNNQGTIAPGASPGILQIDGDYIQSSTGTLLIEMAAPTSYDQLLVSGDVTLGGTLSVALLNGFVPTEGQTFAIFGDQFNAIAGAFDSVAFPTFNGLTFAVSQSLNSINLQVVESVGDFNHNGTIDTADYVVWRKTDGTQAGYDTWRAHFGQSAGTGSAGYPLDASAEPLSAAVPEPATGMMFVMALVAMIAHHRRNFVNSRAGEPNQSQTVI